MIPLSWWRQLARWKDRALPLGRKTPSAKRPVSRRLTVELLEDRLAPSASPVGPEFLVNNAFTTGQQVAPALAVDADGDFVLAWQSDGQDGSSWGIYAQRYNAAGVAQGGEFPVNTYTTGSQAGAAVAMDADGDFVIAWSSNGQDGSSYGVYAQRYNAAGVAQGGEFRVNSFTTGDQSGWAVAMDADGDFVLAWESRRPGRQQRGRVRPAL